MQIKIFGFQSFNFKNTENIEARSKSGQILRISQKQIKSLIMKEVGLISLLMILCAEGTGKEEGFLNF